MATESPSCECTKCEWKGTHDNLTGEYPNLACPGCGESADHICDTYEGDDVDAEEEFTPFTAEYISEHITPKLVVGAKIKLGPEWCKGTSIKPGTVIELVNGEFEHENGLYTETVTAPAVWNEDQREFDSIYHLFGNDIEDFDDCEIL